MNSQTNANLWRLVVVIAICLAFTLTMTAQVQTTTSTTPGASNKEVTVERGEVLRVQGNDLWVKMDDGSERHFPNVSESARVTVDGKQVGIHDLKPGMHLQRTLTVTTTPTTVTTVETVTGKVWAIHPPNNVILTLENGQNQQFKIPKGQKFTVDGKETDAWGLKKGMNVSATRVTEVPQTVIAHQHELTGKWPPPPPPIPADTPILIASAAPAPAAPAAAAETTAATLPKTGSPLPLIGLLGLVLTGSGLGLKLVRR